ncbi:MAG: glycosyltransferase family 39 protein [Nanoarchaeota archaeon]|nr:glycosyltransferase family 39 protein [Nanoarchaeota archaeon]MBU4456952.1 glycosyltransferase family 39 protein [Nanoarchaeota archaeon]MCG2720054.1 glycosyltransferase family 39 protein [Nanoarchaeota archaeon]
MKLKIILVMVLAFILQTMYLFKDYTIWWDASVYLGMGKYLFSLGQLGIWEPIRPLIWPLLLGLFWKLGYDQIWVGKLLTILFSLGSIYMTYLIGKKFGEDEGVIAAMLLAFTAVFFSFTFRLYTEIPSVFFALTAIYFFLENKFVLAGSFSALAFLTKFPQGILLIVFSFLTVKEVRNFIKLIGAFALVTLPYFIFNFIMYKNPLIPLLWGSVIVKRAGSWLFEGPWYFYFIEILKQNILYIFAVIGFIILLKRKHKAIILIASLFLLYFSTHIHKEIRFGIVFLPYLALFAAVGIKNVFKQKWMFWIITILSLFLLFMNLQPDYNPSEAAQNYYQFLEDKGEIEGEILSMQPIVNLYSPKKVEPMYFMVFDSELAQKWIDYINDNKENVSYVFLDTCEGGMLCPPTDDNCETKKEELISLLKANFNIAYEASISNCEYLIFQQTPLLSS